MTLTPVDEVAVTALGDNTYADTRRRAVGAVVMSPSLRGKKCAGWRAGDLRYRPDDGIPSRRLL